MITQKELKAILKYNQNTGDFTWVKPTSFRVRVGDVCGTKTKSGYITAGIYGKRYYCHRLAWLYVYGVWPAQIDHINHAKDDNRIENIRESNQRENAANCSLSKRNTTGVTGVYWDRNLNKWRVKIMSKGVNIHIGLFSDKFEAICARKSANNKYSFHNNHGG